MTQGEVGGAGQPSLVQALGEYRRGSGVGTRVALFWGLPSEGRRRRSEANPQESCQDGTPSPRSHRCRRLHRRHRPHRGTLPQAPPSIWSSLGVSPALGARDSSSFPSSFLSPSRTSAFLQTLAACHDRPRPPLPGAWKIEHRSIPARAKVSLKRRSKEIDDRNRKQEKELTRSIDPWSGLIGSR